MTAIAQPLSSNMEDYLEAIFLLIRENAVARSKDIARILKVNRSSVTGALKALAGRGLVNYAPYGYITLTNQGTEIASRVLRRHEALRDFFVKVLSVPEQDADEAACRMEHGISKLIVDRLIEFAEFTETCPRAGSKWIRGFGYQCQSASKEKCEQCISECLTDVKNSKEEGVQNSMIITVDKLNPGEKGKIKKLAGYGAVKKRIRDMGVTTDSLIEVVRVAPMGDPIDIKVRGYHLSLRKEDAANISVRKV